MDIQVNINRYSDSWEERPSRWIGVRRVMRGGDQGFAVAPSVPRWTFAVPLGANLLLERTCSSFEKERAGVADPLFALRSAVP
jgi:hypothetical protein